MDYYNIDSEVTESLDFLSPPVERIYRNISREKYQQNNAYNHHNKLLKDFRTVTKQTSTQLPVIDKPTDGPSSTSLVLKRTTEREILERYSVLSYTNLQYSNQSKKQATNQNPTAKDRPLIKVTVIPNNSAETQITKLRKRRHVKKVQSTVSNQENSIKAKNVYLVVAGRKREKIYEIKTTGSADFSNNFQHFQNEDNAIEKVTHFKQLISSLNMDKKKKTRKKELSQKGSRTSLVNEVLEGVEYNDCPCSNNVQHGACRSPMDVRARKSRVRISGRIGFTEDDKYVLRYATTVDGDPMEANHSKVQRSVIKCSNGRCRKDSNVQADLRREKSNKNQADGLFSKETQCTQSNFNTVVFSNIDKLEITSKRDEVIQCHCSQSSEDVTRYEYERDRSKDYSSPLVIISVYPKQDSKEKVNNDKSPIRSNTNRPTTQRTNVFNMNTNLRVRSLKPKTDKDIESKDVSPRNRSPSPSRSPMRSRVEHTQIAQEKGITRKKIGQKETTTLHTDTGSPRKKNDHKEVISKPNTGTVRKHFEYKEIITTSTKKTNKAEQANQIYLKNNAPQARPVNKRQQDNMKTENSSQHVTKGTNTDHTLKKKALVDSYTKKLAAQMKQKKVMNWTPPDNDVSNVTINIDGENEFYDVLFRQGDLTTDLRICKTVKEKGSQKLHDKDDNSASLENFFLVTEDGERRKKSFSQTYLLGEPSINKLALSKPMSRLNVRDSIEISHRRENRISVLSNTPQTNAATYNNYSNKDDSRIFFAPIKHYRGDSCTLPDPLKRDKEIRELLGIDSRRPNTLKSRIEEESISANEDHSLHCFYQTRCENKYSFETEIQDSMCSIFKLIPAPCCCPDNDQASVGTERKKESDQSDSSKPSSSEESSSSEQNKKDQRTQHIRTATKQETVSKVKDSEQSDSVESKQKEKKTNLNKRASVSKPTDSDQTDSDESKQIQQKSSDTLQKRSKHKLKDSNESYSDQSNKINRKSNHSLKKGTKPKPKDSDESDSDQPKKFRKSSHSLKIGTRTKPKDSDESDSDQPIKKDHKSKHSIKHGNKTKPIDSDRSLKKDSHKNKSKDYNQSDSDEQGKIDKKKRLTEIKEKYSKQKLKDTAEKRQIISNNKNSDQSDSDQTHNSKERRYSVDQPPLYQQLILNRNINVYLQIEQFTKQKPIVLTRKQYDKVKKTIENASTKRTKMCICTKSSSISLGEVRKKPKTASVHVDKSVQAEPDMKAIQNKQNTAVVKRGVIQNTEPIKQTAEEPIKEKPAESPIAGHKEKLKEKPKEKSKEKRKENLKDKPKERQTEKPKHKTTEKPKNSKEKVNEESKGTQKEKAKEKTKEKSKKISQKEKVGKYCPCCGEYQTNEVVACEHCGRQKNICCQFCGKTLYLSTCNSCFYCSVGLNQTLVLFDNKGTQPHEEDAVNVTENDKMKSSKHAASSLEIRYTSVAFMKHVTFSSTEVAENAPNPSASSIAKKNSYHSDSLYTIFKGHKKAPTPNLGTSAYSLYSEYSDAKSPDLEAPQDLKQRKPFLKRLISCLVMRSKASALKMGRPVPKMASVNSSIDSYHISTSLGAIELSSSIYDTSASFYSNHTIMPVNSKMKRGFLSSVRGFLTTTRRS